MFGFLNIYKPTGMTSHDVVAILRKITKIKQIGHTGTLDPFAQGVLPIAIGKSTRLIEYLDDDKEYLAEITFGKSTDSYDCDGNITSESDLKVTLNQITENLKSFEGEILQTPPIYSAIKVKGKKLYEYARAGEEVKIEPRKVFIEKIEFKEFDAEKQIAQVLIKCSKGTYIRSIANDLGQNLDCGAYLSKLIRTQAGDFFVDNARSQSKQLSNHAGGLVNPPYVTNSSKALIVNLDDIKSIADVEKNLINPLDIINLPKVEIDENDYKKILHGQFIENKNNLKNETTVILTHNNEIAAIANTNEKLIKAKKVFA